MGLGRNVRGGTRPRLSWGPFVVVDAQPLTCQGLQVGNRFEEMGVEDLRAIHAVEALDVGVLIRLPRPDVVAGHPVLGAPVDEALGGESRPTAS